MANQSLSILLIEDDSLIVQLLKTLLPGHRLTIFPNLRDYLQGTEVNSRFDLVLLDLCHPRDPSGGETIGLIQQLKQKLPRAEVVVQSGVQDLGLIRQCLKMGAEKFVLKDHLGDEIPLLLERAAQRQLGRKEIDALIMGESPVMQELKQQLLNLRHETHWDVLIEGETGSGKELCASALHVEGPFVAVNVSAIPKNLFEAEFFGAEKGAYTGSTSARPGYLESAEKGILFLDEIQNLDLELQAKILRVLENRTFHRVGSTTEKRFNGRIVCASNESLREKVKNGVFREDLYFRLVNAKITVPPLRIRGDDIIALASAFLLEADSSKKIKLTDAAKEWMKSSYDWPGNVRELKSLIRRLVASSKMPFIDKEECAERIAQDELAETKQLASTTSGNVFTPLADATFDENVAAFEKHLLASTLAKYSGQEARDRLKLSRTRFYEKLRAYSLKS